MSDEWPFSRSALLNMIEHSFTPGQLTDEELEELTSAEPPPTWPMYEPLYPVHQAASARYHAALVERIKAATERIRAPGADSRTRQHFDTAQWAIQDNRSVFPFQELYRRCRSTLAAAYAELPAKKAKTEADPPPVASTTTPLTLSMTPLEMVSHYLRERLTAGFTQPKLDSLGQKLTFESGVVANHWWTFYSLLFGEEEIDRASTASDVAAQVLLSACYGQPCGLESVDKFRYYSVEDDESGGEVIRYHAAQAALDAAITPEQPYRVLDLGCGVGTLGKEVAKRFLQPPAAKATGAPPDLNESSKGDTLPLVPAAASSKPPTRGPQKLIIDGLDSSSLALAMLPKNVARWEVPEAHRSLLSLYKALKRININDVHSPRSEPQMPQSLIRAEDVFPLQSYDAVVSSDFLMQGTTGGYPGPEAICQAWKWIKPGGMLVMVNSWAIVNPSEPAFYMNALQKRQPIASEIANIGMWSFDEHAPEIVGDAKKEVLVHIFKKKA